jgi:hypothetical protein
VHYRDFPLSTRVLLAVTILLFLVNAIVFLVGITAIVVLLSDKGIHPALWSAAITIVSVILGSSGTLFVQRYMARVNRETEAHDVAASLHAEISDRAARCLNDYLNPWKSYADQAFKLKKARDRANINKFRPMSPVAYPAVASKLGLLSPDALFCVTQFYFRLGVVQREIDDLLNDKNAFAETDLVKVKKRCAVVTGRLREALGPALLALDNLKVTGSSEIEDAAVRAYRHTRAAGIGLRKGLEANQVDQNITS